MTIWGGAIPYAVDRNLGAAYNAEMRLIGDDDWRIFIDHDALVGLSRDWYHRVVEAIAAVPDAGAIVAVTNRIDASWQRAAEADKHNHDIAYHTRVALAREQSHRTLLDVTGTKGFGGVAFAVSKAAWRLTPGFADGMLCVDHSIHFALRAIGRRIYLHEGWYVYHRRRAEVGELPADTPRVANCPCRGSEAVPHRRVRLPERRIA